MRYRTPFCGTLEVSVYRECDKMVYIGKCDTLVRRSPPLFVSARSRKVFVITQHWGKAYYHFLSECLPRLTLMLDVLLEHTDIMVRLAYDDYFVFVHRRTHSCFHGGR